MTQEIKNILNRLKQLMCGFNYQVSFGIDILEECKTLGDVYYQLKIRYKDIKSETVQLVSFTETDFWEEIDFGFAFRGDSAAGLMLTPAKEESVKLQQIKYKFFIQQFLSGDTKIYSYPSEEGIPFCVVYWGYAFILLNENRPSLFIFGAASD